MLFAWIKGHNYERTPDRYVGAAEMDADDVPFIERVSPLREKLHHQFSKANQLKTMIQSKLAGIVVDE